jgi:hypothetical protein
VIAVVIDHGEVLSCCRHRARVQRGIRHGRSRWTGRPWPVLLVHDLRRGCCRRECWRTTCRDLREQLLALRYFDVAMRVLREPS